MLKIKCDINLQDLKRVDPHLSNLNNFHSLEVVDRVSETQLQVGENSNWIIWRLKGWDRWGKKCCGSVESMACSGNIYVASNKTNRKRYSRNTYVASNKKTRKLYHVYNGYNKNVVIMFPNDAGQHHHILFYFTETKRRFQVLEIIVSANFSSFHCCF